MYWGHRLWFCQGWRHSFSAVAVEDGITQEVRIVPAAAAQ
ncbi:hypothetical protein CLV52_3415 [Amnibacterium kyonggiense]|uniref:Uncharacterized protein n=1 Tax=Amnibacterium kyonggiense TaxID=595671 RepID=A0A4R7FFH3_9MICO|nr:hypothetical protein CLV52_3415 [Amnibacterium kyonggiense]